MRAHRTIGHHMRLFSVTRGQPTSSDCVLECHGGQTLLNVPFTVPSGLHLHFYVPQGVILEFAVKVMPADEHGKRHRFSGLTEAIRCSRAVPAESFGPGTACPNYTLGKLHKAGSLSGRTMAALSLSNRTRAGYDDLERYCAETPGSPDIVSIRNRRGRPDPSLKDVVRQLAQFGHYRDIHCTFCRSSTLGVLPGLRRVARAEGEAES